MSINRQVSERKVNNMNNQNHTHNEQRRDENSFGYILKRALLHLPDEKIDTAQAKVRHSSVPDHNRARINPDRAGMRCQHAECQEMRL